MFIQSVGSARCSRATDTRPLAIASGEIRRRRRSRGRKMFKDVQLRVSIARMRDKIVPDVFFREGPAGKGSIKHRPEWPVSPRIKPSRRFPLDAAEETYKRIIAVLVKKVILRHSIASATSNDVPPACCRFASCCRELHRGRKNDRGDIAGRSARLKNELIND